jgi:hypothetical protein
MAVSLALLGGGGCALDGSTEPQSARAAAREAVAVVERLERASARGDWRSVCADIFTAGARRRAGGRDCPRLLRSHAGRLTRPRIDVLRVTARGRGLAVRVRSRARGQPPLEDVIELRRERGRYRIEALGG